MENMNQDVNFTMNSNPNVYSNPENRSANQPVNRPMQEPKKKKKSGGFKKVVALILSGILLGSVAGVTLYGVNALATYIDPVGKIFSTVGITDEKKMDNKVEDGMEIDKQTIPTIQSTQTHKVDTVTDVSEIAKDVMPSLVSIVNEYTAVQDFGYFGSYEQSYKASGSGIIVGQNDTELLMVTNYHVVEAV